MSITKSIIDNVMIQKVRCSHKMVIVLKLSVPSIITRCAESSPIKFSFHSLFFIKNNIAIVITLTMALIVNNE